jgi:glycosyltransferase involved in cell wall biosynthesis
MSATSLKTVSIVYYCLPQYRVDFFSGLREALAKNGIELNLIFGRNKNTPKQDQRDLNWAIPVNNVNFNDSTNELIWQPVPDSIYSSDLIILLQMNKVLSNHLILLKARLLKQKVGLWGHGVNYKKRDPRTLGNRLKKLYSTKVDWWFAYTTGVADKVAGMGFPKERITVVQNAINTRQLIAESLKIDEDQVRKMKNKLGIGDGPLGIFCGGMYKEKRLEFLLQACRQLRERIPNFEIIFVGAGPDAHKVQRASMADRWMHYVGPKFDSDRVPYFKMADVFLMPGLVGLAVLDSFALETPMVTTQIPFHSPEIEYLKDGENGLITENTVSKFVVGVQKVISSHELLSRLKAGCRRSASQYGVEYMVNNFAEGIERALATPRRV